MSAAELLTRAEGEAICRSAQNIAAEVERMTADFGLVVADRDRLRLAHYLALDPLARLRAAIRSGDTQEADAILATIILHTAVHAYGTVAEPLPRGVVDLDEVRGERIAAAMNGGAR